MSSKTLLAKWGLQMDSFQQYLVRCGNICSGDYLRYHIHLKNSNKTVFYLQRNSSSHVVKSPFPAGDIPKTLIPDLISESVDKNPEVTAMRCALTGRSYTYAELQKLSRRFSNSLVKAGFSPREVIAVALPNCPEFMIVVLGVIEADLTVTLMNHTYTRDEMYHQLKDSGSVCIVTGVGRLSDLQLTIAKLEANIGSNPIRKIIAMDIADPNPIPEGVAKFSEAIADHVDHSKKTSSVVTPDDLAVMPYSSGTTGLAKGVCLSHSNCVSCFHQCCFSGIGSYGPGKGQDLVLGLLPFFHIYGFLIMGFTLKDGGQILTLSGFKPEFLISTMDKEKLSMLFLVPPIILFLGAHPAVSEKHLAHVRMVITGADLIEAAPLEKLKTKLPSDCVLSQGYGMTETSGFAMIPTHPVKNLTTVGTPAALTEAKIVCTETGADLGPKKTGELCFRGPQIMLGYNNNPTATADMIDGKGWLHSGDIGYYDEDNHFYIQGRLKELIKVKGFQVPPAELEVILRALPGVSDAAVIGVPDPVTGETPVAYVVKTSGATLTEDQVRAYLARKVAKHKQVSKVFFVDQIPKSPSGKILRKELQEWFSAGVQ